MESVSVSENVLCTMQIKHGVIQNVSGFMKSQSDNTHTARYKEGIKSLAYMQACIQLAVPLSVKYD